MHAYIPLPPPGENTYNLEREDWKAGLDERQWTADKRIKRGHKGTKLTGDRAIKGLWTYPGATVGTSDLDLAGHRLTLGSEGIVVDAGTPARIVNGTLTSSVGQIKIRPIGTAGYLLPISAVIADNGRLSVGIDIVGPSSWLGYRGAGLDGDRANTFTGAVNVTGGARLDLYKADGVVAISGDLNVREGAIVSVFRSNQIARHSQVLLQSKGHASTFIFSNMHRRHIEISFHSLKVEGIASINFGEGKADQHGSRWITVDDLELTAGSLLKIYEWEDGRDHLLVHKGSAHLKSALKGIEFDGYDSRTVDIRDYDGEHWEIYALLPEAQSYGTLFALSSTALFLLRHVHRQHRQRRPPAP